MADAEKVDGTGLSEVQLDALKFRIGKWLLTVLVPLALAAGSVLTLIFKEIAEDTAEQGVTQGVIRELYGDPEFLRLVEERSAVPLGTVIAIDSPECPEGPWRLFDKGSGRFIIGSGSGNVDKDREPLSERRWAAGSGTAGGVERVSLTPLQLPSHSHKIRDPGHNHGFTWGFAATKERFPEREPIYVVDVQSGRPLSREGSTSIEIMPNGGDEAHDNMPPFIVLTLCERI